MGGIPADNTFPLQRSGVGGNNNTGFQSLWACSSTHPPVIQSERDHKYHFVGEVQLDLVLIFMFTDETWSEGCAQELRLSGYGPVR